MTRVHTLKAQVEEVLRNEPETRNSDIKLTIAIWRRFYPAKIKKGASGEEGVLLKDLFDLPREDNVKRVRAQFNADGKFFPTDWEVAKARGIQQDQWRVALGYPRKDQTMHPTQGDAYMDEQRDYRKQTLGV